MKILEVNNIRKEFGTLVAVNDLNFCLEKGQVLGLIGPNGAGKTTLLRILATLLRPTDGSAQVLGNDLATDYLEIRKRVGFLPDFFNLYNDLTLQECLEFFARAYGVPLKSIADKVETALQYVELKDKQHSFIRHLSRGMVQRMGLATLLVRDPEIFLLDEPASGLDPRARIQMRNVLKKLSDEGKTIIISSHILTELSGFCSHIAIMDHGNIALYGAVDEIQQKVFNASTVTISVLENVEAATEFIKENPKIKITSVEGNTISIQMSTDSDKLAYLNEVLVKKGFKVSRFCEEKTDLEDVFMKISSSEQ